jgi:hypothetical protein
MLLAGDVQTAARLTDDLADDSSWPAIRIV